MILYNFRKDLENLINNSGLPIDAAYFVLKDIMHEMDNIYKQEIKKEEVEAAKAAAAQYQQLDDDNKTND